MPVIEEVCTITAKGQTTVPIAIRRALKVGQGDRIAFRVENGVVTLHAVEASETDPALAPFLTLLAADLAARPKAIAAIPPATVARIDAVLDGLSIDPDEPIQGDVAL